MPATYVTAATLKASLGVGTLYDSYTWIEDTCQAAQDLINGFLWFDNAPVVGTALLTQASLLLASLLRLPGQVQPLTVLIQSQAQFLLAQVRLIFCLHLICSLIIGNFHRAIALSNMQRLQAIKTLGVYCLTAL
jgi:hypothetical protein